MIRGTTPTHIFEFPFDIALVKRCNIIYKQLDKVVLTKKESDCQVKENSYYLKLTQKETLLFDCKKPVRIQLHVLTESGDALNSDIIEKSVGECLDTEVLT